MRSGYRVRPGKVEDATSIARVHIETWLTTYRGLVSDRLLDGMASETESRVQKWKDNLASPGSWITLVAEDSSGRVVGFCRAGPDRGSNPVFTAEVGAIYVLKEHQRHGVGCALFEEAAGLLREAGHRGLLVWVLEGNPYREFYERLGGRTIEEKVEEIRGEARRVVAYGWDGPAFKHLAASGRRLRG